MELKKQDYEEPCCPLKRPGSTTPIPIGRVMEKLDQYYAEGNPDGARRHLEYWLTEAEQLHDDRGRLTVLNELIGLSRKQGRKNDCLQAAREALELIDTLKMDGTITQATTYINAATGFRAFEMSREALPLFQSAQTIYETLLPSRDARLGGLYNNMALTLTELGEYSRAEELYRRALDVMTAQPHGETEQAITYLNLADLAAAQYGIEAGEEQIISYLDKAEALLDAENIPRNGEYAFACEKCAPVFGYYGYFRTEEKLSARARQIYGMYKA